MRTPFPRLFPSRFSFSSFALAVPLLLADMVAPCGGSKPCCIVPPADATAETAGSDATTGTATSPDTASDSGPDAP